MTFLERIRSDHIHARVRAALDVTSQVSVEGASFITATAEGRYGQGESEEYDALVNGKHFFVDQVVFKREWMVNE